MKKQSLKQLIKEVIQEERTKVDRKMPASPEDITRIAGALYTYKKLVNKLKGISDSIDLDVARIQPEVEEKIVDKAIEAWTGMEHREEYIDPDHKPHVAVGDEEPDF